MDPLLERMLKSDLGRLNPERARQLVEEARRMMPPVGPLTQRIIPKPQP